MDEIKNFNNEADPPAVAIAFVQVQLHFQQ